MDLNNLMPGDVLTLRWIDDDLDQGQSLIAPISFLTKDSMSTQAYLGLSCGSLFLNDDEEYISLTSNCFVLIREGVAISVSGEFIDTDGKTRFSGGYAAEVVSIRTAR